jgi:PAS domain S-box-containing protein
MFEGQDYRGVEVLGDLRPVPGSPWFLVSKVDKSEILAEARYRAVVIAAVVLLFIMLLGAVTAYAYRQRAEAVLRESEQRYRIITENMGDMVWFMDMDFKVTYISPSMFRARGFTLTEFETLPLEKNLSPASMQVVARVLAEELTPERLAQKDLKIERVLELELCRKDGSSFWSEETITLIRDRQGKPSGLVGVGRDITERKRAEAALRESEERHRTIIQTATDGFWLVDMEGRLLEVNESYCRMSGYSERELLAMRIPELEAVEAREDTAAHIQKIMAQGEDRFESRHRRKDGSIFKIETSVQYRPGDGGRLVVFLHDITERKRAEAALRESEERYRSLFENSRDAIMTL